MIIEHIDQILPHLEGRDEFIVVGRDGYRFVDYVYQQDDTFADPVRLECRGIKFDENGRILARPLQKFFNVGEKEQPHEIDLSRPHQIFDKLDGTMIHSAWLNDDLVFMTRKGVTDHARAAFDRFGHRYDYMRFCVWTRVNDFTPVFEYVAPDNRIVVQYDEPALVLIGLRDTVSGEHVKNHELRGIAQQFDIPFAGSPEEALAVSDMRAFVDDVRAETGVEGYVIRFDDGHMLKIKTEEYVAMHRALDDLSNKRKVVALVLDGFADDVVPVLGYDDARELTTFSDQLNYEIACLARDVSLVVHHNEVLDRKEFAVNVVAKYEPGYLRPCLFHVRDGKLAINAVRGLLRKHPEHVRTLWRGQ